MGRKPGSGVNKPKGARPVHVLKCKTCGSDFRSFESWRRVCSPACYAKPVRVATYGRPGDPNRKQRLKMAPGLSPRELAMLLRKWKRQGRCCTYCGATATTVDHVLPLCRGGSQYIGNLTPACRSCNSRKGSMLLVEFRAGRLSAQQQRFAGYSAAKRKHLV